MSSGLLPNLNSAFYFGVQRLRVKLAPTHKLIESLAVKRSEKFEACYTCGITKHSAIEAFSQTCSSGGGVVSRSSSQVFEKFSRATAAGCENVSSFAKPARVYFSNRGLNDCRKVSLSLRNQEGKSSSFVHSCSILGVRRKSSSSNALVGSWFKSCSTSSSSSCYSTGAAAPDVSIV